jgi:hypothetical protein
LTFMGSPLSWFGTGFKLGPPPVKAELAPARTSHAPGRGSGAVMRG